MSPTRIAFAMAAIMSFSFFVSLDDFKLLPLISRELSGFNKNIVLYFEEYAFSPTVFMCDFNAADIYFVVKGFYKAYRVTDVTKIYSISIDSIGLPPSSIMPPVIC